MAECLEACVLRQTAGRLFISAIRSSRRLLGCPSSCTYSVGCLTFGLLGSALVYLGADRNNLQGGGGGGNEEERRGFNSDDVSMHLRHHAKYIFDFNSRERPGMDVSGDEAITTHIQSVRQTIVEDCAIKRPPREGLLGALGQAPG